MSLDTKNIDTMKLSTYKHLMQHQGQRITIALVDLVDELLDIAYEKGKGDGQSEVYEDSEKSLTSIAEALEETKVRFSELLDIIENGDHKQSYRAVDDLLSELKGWVNK